MAATTLSRSPAETSRPRRSGTRSRASELAWALLRWATVGLALIVTIVPFFWLVTTSFKREIDYLAYPPELIPPVWTLDGYRVLFEQQDLGHFFMNSVIVTLTSTALASTGRTPGGKSLESGPSTRATSAPRRIGWPSAVASALLEYLRTTPKGVERIASRFMHPR